jgi:hypothetical protein
LNKSLIDLRLSQDTEAFAVDTAGDDAHGAIAAGALAAAVGVDFHTGTARCVKERCIRLYVDSNPGWLKSYKRHTQQINAKVKMQNVKSEVVKSLNRGKSQNAKVNYKESF